MSALVLFLLKLAASCFAPCVLLVVGGLHDLYGDYDKQCQRLCSALLFGSATFGVAAGIAFIWSL